MERARRHQDESLSLTGALHPVAPHRFTGKFLESSGIQSSPASSNCDPADARANAAAGRSGLPSIVRSFAALATFTTRPESYRSPTCSMRTSNFACMKSNVSSLLLKREPSGYFENHAPIIRASCRARYSRIPYSGDFAAPAPKLCQPCHDPYPFADTSSRPNSTLRCHRNPIRSERMRTSRATPTPPRRDSK